MRTRRLDEAIDAVSKVYCPHTVKVIRPARDIDAFLDIYHPTTQPLVTLSYSVPVEIDAGNFPRLFLMMHCSRGSASADQEGRSAEWRSGQTLPFSAGFDTQLQFDGAFVQKSIRLDPERLENLCVRWLGRPLDERLRFALRPFSPELERIWQNTLAYLWANQSSGLRLDGAARASFDEFLLTLLLHHHPHTYSDELTAEAPAPVPAIVRRAERYMIDRAEAPITISDVAAGLGVSVRTLQAGFRHWRNTTPNAFLRQVRLHRAHEALLRAGEDGNVTAIALTYGFSHLGRFSAYYQAAFGEAPSATLRRRASNPRT